MIRRVGRNLGLLDEAVPEAIGELERDGYTVLRGVLAADEVAALAAEIERCSTSATNGDGPTATSSGTRCEPRARSQRAVGHRRSSR